MDQNPELNPDESDLETATAALATSLSENAASMWQHYKTVQACEPHLRMGRDPAIKSTGENTDEEMNILDGIENRQKLGISQEQEGREGSNGAEEALEDGESQSREVLEGGTAQSRDISLAVAALVPLPHSSSPPDSQQSSPSSSCFITPASTPSRSRSPPPHSPLHPSQQVTLPQGESVDGCQDNNRNYSDGPYVPHSPMPLLPNVLDAETQTHSITVENSFSQTDTLVTQDSSTNTEKEEAPVLIDNESQTDGKEGWEGERREVGCNTQLQISPELLERAQLTEEIARLRSQLAAGKQPKIKH